MAKFNLRSKRTWKKILSVGLGILLTVGAIVGISALVNKSEEKTKEINPKFSIGALTEDGKYSESKESIYSDAFECQGLSVQLAFDHNISYEIFYYNEYSDFISSTGTLTENYNTVDNLMPFGTEFARIVITPNDDTKISWYEKSSYANQLEIKVAKEQDKSINVEEPVDLFIIDEEKIGFILSLDSNNEPKYNENEYVAVAKPIDCSNISKLKFVFEENATERTISYYFFNSSNVKCFSDTFTNAETSYIIEVPDDATTLYVNYRPNEPFSIYKVK